MRLGAKNYIRKYLFERLSKIWDELKFRGVIFPRPYDWGICRNTDIALKPVMHRFSLDILCVVLGFSKDPPCHFPFGKNDTRANLAVGGLRWI
ncbi:hypothetical protein AGMMS49592_2990 [Endomicrobiia bacterium]|nr:hypothetical protein AGMMS49592_2990 [Endomicrobiia bacterium]